jgi:hypothetical protein
VDGPRHDAVDNLTPRPPELLAILSQTFSDPARLTRPCWPGPMPPSRGSASAAITEPKTDTGLAALMPQQSQIALLAAAGHTN